MDALSKSKVHALLYIVANTLAGVFAIAMFPGYRIWTLATLPGLAIALLAVRQQQTRLLLLVSYLLLGLGGLAVGHYYPGDAGTEGRITMAIVALPVIGFTMARLAAVELGKA